MAKKFMQTSMLLIILPKKPGITLSAYTPKAFVVGLWLNGLTLVVLKFPNFSTFLLTIWLHLNDRFFFIVYEN